MDRLRPECIGCVYRRHIDQRSVSLAPKQRLEYMRRAIHLLADAPKEEGAPVMIWHLKKLQREFFEQTDLYYQEKKYYNQLMLKLEEPIQQRVDRAKDSVLAAMTYALAGNYIDFGAMNQVEDEYLFDLLKNSEKVPLNQEVYSRFQNDLTTKHNMVYLTDNCGEIVVDKILIRKLMQKYPNLNITVIVRGEPVLNDATLEDAKQVGLTSLVKVIDNGNGVAGTYLNALGNAAKQAIENAEIIFSKGQGNFETLRGCNKNVYYLFLCKCEMFANQFSVPKLTGMLLHDDMCKK